MSGTAFRKALLTACLAAAVLFFPASQVLAQTATAVSARNRPSNLTIRKHFFEQEQARIKRELRVIMRCIDFAKRHMRDVQGNVNQIAKTNLINCGRRLRFIQERANSLARKGQKLEFDVQMMLLMLAQQYKQQGLANNLSGQ
jgi:hypothetical protein